MEIRANFIYELQVCITGNEGGFILSGHEWSDGSHSDWLPAGSGITVPDSNAEIIEGTVIKGTYAKIGPEASLPYRITKTVIDSNHEDIIMTADNGFPSWIEVRSTTTPAGENIYRHDIEYTVSTPPGDNTRFAITYPEGSTDDSEILAVGFIDPYPGTPLPCLSWGSNFYSPVHAGQTGYLARNTGDPAYYAGKTGYTLYTTDNPFINGESAEPCPDGWRTVTDAEAKDLLEWVGGNLKGTAGEGIYTYNWFGNPTEATNLRFHAGYARTGHGPAINDIACFGNWPNVAWLLIDQENLTVSDSTFGNEWIVTEGYAVPYRCIRPMDGWK